MYPNENLPSDLKLKTPGSFTVAIGWVILICDVVITLVLWYVFSNNAKTEALARFQFRSQEIQVAVEDRLFAYEQVLKGGVGLFEATGLEVDREMFKTYVDNLNIEEHYRGIQGIGFSKAVTPEDKEKHIKEIRESSGFSSYTIKPEGKREQYTAIVYLEPFADRNLRAFGYDMLSEPVRRQAMNLARDTGKPSITGKVTLVQETGEDIQTGFLMYLPVYKKNMPLNSVEERRAALFGFVYSHFRTRDFMEGVLGQRKIPDIAFSFYALSKNGGKALLYNSTPDHEDSTSLFHEKRDLGFHDSNYSHIYSLELNSLKAFEKTIEQGLSTAVLIIGLLVSLVFFTVLWLTHTARNRAVQYGRKINESLIESENRLRNFLDHSPALIFIKDWEGRYTYSNRKNEILTGISKQSILGKTTQEVFPKHIADQFDVNDKKLMATLVPQVVEETVPQKEGPPLKFLSTQFALFDSKNNPYAICGISMDITKQKAAEEKLLQHQEELEELVLARTREIQKTLAELRENEERFNLTFAATSEGVWDWNIKTGEVFFSSQWFKSLGYEPNELPGHVDTWKNILHPDDKPAAMEKLNAHLEGKTDSYECENRLKTKSGAWIWNLDRGKVVARDTEGNPLRMVGTDSDITQRKNIESDLKIRENELAQAQEIAHLGSWTWNVQGKTLSWSDEVYRILGLDPKECELTYEKYLCSVHEEDRKRVHRVNQESVLGKQSYDIKLRIIQPNGEIKYVQQQSKTEYDRQGYPLKVVGIIHDINNKELSEKALVKNREKFRLLYNQISEVLEGTSSATSGEKFFQSLVFHLATTLGFQYCFVGQLDPKSKKLCNTIAFIKDEEYIPRFQYKLANTPCEKIYQGTTIFYTDNLQEAFPDDDDIEKLGLSCYFGVPIFGKNETPIAHLAVMDRKPSEYLTETMSILSLFAARAGAELTRIEINKELEVSRERLRKLNKKLQSVREEEKLHLAREIHDELGQVISYCKLDLLWAQKKIKAPEDPVFKKLESTISHLDSTLKIVQKISGDLRPQILDVLGISEAMKWQAKKFKNQTFIEYELEIVPEKIICDRDQSVDLFRIFQETLTNISRHAQATLVQIKFTQEENYFSLSVKDNGKGFDTALLSQSHSFGILGMKERSLIWNGEVDIQSEPGVGTSVSVRLPIKENNESGI